MLLTASACLAGGLAEADSWTDLADVAARIEYGFHAEEPGMVEAARTALERSGERGEAAEYYRALAALRLASLQPATDGRTRERLAECSRLAPHANAEAHTAAEFWVLSAACALAAVRLEPMRGLLQQRRAAQALDRAAALDPGNPRLALLRAEALADAGGAMPSAEAVAALDRAVAAFERAPRSGPQWGEAEALAQLAAARLAEGRLQAARDLIERALQIAPDYRFATAVRDRITGAP